MYAFAYINSFNPQLPIPKAFNNFSFLFSDRLSYKLECGFVCMTETSANPQFV